MQPTDMAKFSQLMSLVWEQRQTPLSETVLELFWRSLSDYPFETIERAFTAYLKNPDVRYGSHLAPGDIIRHITGDTDTQALRAWSRLLELISQVGQYETLVTDDPILHQVVGEMGGWICLCQSNRKDLQFRQAEFRKRYASYVVNPPQSYPPRLKGWIEWQNEQQGYPAPPPLLIGNPQKVLQVYEQREFGLLGAPLNNEAVNAKAFTECSKFAEMAEEKK